MSHGIKHLVAVLILRWGAVLGTVVAWGGPDSPEHLSMPISPC
jgi:hypothetical protein